MCKYARQVCDKTCARFSQNVCVRDDIGHKYEEDEKIFQGVKERRLRKSRFRLEESLSDDSSEMVINDDESLWEEMWYEYGL